MIGAAMVCIGLVGLVLVGLDGLLAWIEKRAASGRQIFLPKRITSAYLRACENGHDGDLS